MRAGTQRVILLISSPGGNVFAGISAYNYLKGAPIEIETDNFGSVDSIAVLLYCAGSKRYSVAQADFLLHPIAASISGGVTLDEPAIQEQLRQMENQTKSIASIIATTTGQKQTDVQTTIERRTTLSADEAKKWGLVQSIREELIPKDSQVISIQIADHNPPAPNVVAQSAPNPSAVSAGNILALGSPIENAGLSSYVAEQIGSANSPSFSPTAP